MVGGDKMLTVQGEAEGGLDVHGIGVHAHNADQFQHVAGATRGYSQIQRGNALEFELSTSSNSVYMTIINESGSTICKNHEISRSRNYIINHRGALLDAKKKEKWIDTNGRDHMVTYDDEYGFDTKKFVVIMKISALENTSVTNVGNLLLFTVRLLLPKY